MPLGRPPKRPSDAIDSTTNSSRVKLPRLDRSPEDFSSVVKNKLQSYTRTGQACDRCKVRKIRCDGLPEGCSPCANQGLDCFVTDRVTGRTERRGYLQQLECEKSDMLKHIRELEKLLSSNGIEVNPWQWSPHGQNYPPGISLDALGKPVQDGSSTDEWTQVGLVWVKSHYRSKAQDSATIHARADVLELRPTNGYLGLMPDKLPLSSINGTSLSILGTTIDIVSCDTPDMHEPAPGTPIGSPLYNRSVMALLQTALNVNPRPQNVELPSRNDAFQYAQWYFVMIHPYLPVLHKPSFLETLRRMYDDKMFEPSIPEQVTVHMVFATIYFQFGIRNREQPEKHTQLDELSNKHYHWCLAHSFHLLSSQTVTAVQALTMITLHTRNFPKPGCSLVVANCAFSKAIELNLHRAVKYPDGSTNLENELRKRVWWAAVGILATLNGRLGRPMPITVEEFDVEPLVPVPDDYLTEDGISDASMIGQCEYALGSLASRVLPLYMEMHSSIYSVRRDPAKYESTVRTLEAGMRTLQENLPDELMLEKCGAGNQVFALYTQAIFHEFTLLLRHPSACVTGDAKFRADNTRLSEDAARRLLAVLQSLLKIKSLDTTWYQLSIYIGAVFSTLVAHWERRVYTLPLEIKALREQMLGWIEVIAEIGRLMGMGNRLANEVSAIIERTISWIEQDMGRKDACSGGHVHIKQRSTSPYPQPIQAASHENSLSTPDSSRTPSEQRGASDASVHNGYYSSDGAVQASSYPPPTYGDSNGNAIAGDSASYAPNDAGVQYLYGSASSAQGATDDSTATAARDAANPLVAFASQATQHVAAQPTASEDWRMAATGNGGGSTWQNWTAAMADSQDRYSASALLTLGGRTDGGMGDQVGSQQPDLGTTTHTGQWPLLLFDGTAAAGGS